MKYLHKLYFFKQNWITSIKLRFIWFSVIWHDPTHKPTHPPNCTPIHRWGSLHRFQIFKQNWNILISSWLIEFLLIWGSPIGGGWEGGGEYRCVGWCPTFGCMCKQVCTCVCMWIMTSQAFPRDFFMVQPFAIDIIMFNMYVCVCTCLHICVHAHMCLAPPTHSSTHPQNQ